MTVLSGLGDAELTALLASATNAAGKPLSRPAAESPSRTSAVPTGSSDIFGPDDEFDPHSMNERFALVIVGQSERILFEDATTLEDGKRLLKMSAFHAMFENRKIERTEAGKRKLVPWSQLWLEHPERRIYPRGLEFFPDPHGAPGTAGCLNLWRGFSVSAAPEGAAGSYKTFRDHLLNNVCHGSEKLFRWVFGFFAHIVQRPRERIGVALVLRGRMGSGKTKVGEVFGSLIAHHYSLVDDPRYVTGQFNAHMATCLLLQADEAVWAGDKKAEGRIKGQVTAPFQMIERKGVDAIRLPNYVRLIMTSNEDWVVPAGKDERRFCVLDVDPRCAQNHDYFAEMEAELAAGGRERLLADLLTFDLSSANLRQIPRTEALLEQKIESLDAVNSWWFERLMAGAPTRHATQWAAEVPCHTLYSDYVATAEKIGVRRKQSDVGFGLKLAKLVPSLGKVRRVRDVDHDGVVVAKRTWCYVLPTLERAREKFEALLGQQVAWLPVEESAPSADDRDEEVAF
jgi:hypothetical protein